jgi:4-alpha-glucanotransferase
MNLPASPSGNWTWRFLPGSVTAEHARNLRFLAETFGRVLPVDAIPMRV